MEEKMRILLCEDDENLGMLLREYLQAKGYDTELCPDGEAGYKSFLKNKYDLCVLDVMMPKKDGFTLAQEIRAANSEIPIIFLTAISPARLIWNPTAPKSAEPSARSTSCRTSRRPSLAIWITC